MSFGLINHDYDIFQHDNSRCVSPPLGVGTAHLRSLSVQNPQIGDSDVLTYFVDHPLLSYSQDTFDLHCSSWGSACSAIISHLRYFTLEDTKKGGRSGKHRVFSHMASEREYFDLSGPLHLTSVDWDNANNRMTVAASLVQGVYILERDRQERRGGANALAPPWWEFFNFKLLRPLVDDVDSSIFGAMYEFKLHSSQSNDILHQRTPRYVIAFRGTITKTDSVSRDIELDIHIVRNGLHESSRAEIAIQAVRNIVASANVSNIWLSGHSLGSAMAMLCGKTMARTGKFLESFLFNPPYVAAPIERIKDKKLKHGIRFASSVITAGLTIAMKVKQPKNLTFDPFAALSSWVPCLFVNPSDHICSEYIGYFEHRRRMQEIGAGGIERLASQNSLTGLLMSASGKESSEPLHLIPSATLTVNVTPSRDFKEAHGIHQWWKSDLCLESKFYKY